MRTAPIRLTAACCVTRVIARHLHARSFNVERPDVQPWSAGHLTALPVLVLREAHVLSQARARPWTLLALPGLRLGTVSPYISHTNSPEGG